MTPPCSVVLAIQDTTELNYTSHKALSGGGNSSGNFNVASGAVLYFGEG
jgi:hypothetical protein